MTGGPWRVTVDSWLTPEATWFGRRVYVISGQDAHNLPDALRAILDSPPEHWLDPERCDTEGRGPAPAVDFPPLEGGTE